MNKAAATEPNKQASLYVSSLEVQFRTARMQWHLAHLTFLDELSLTYVHVRIDL